MKNLKATPFVLLLGIMLGVNLTISRFSIGQIPPTSLAAFRFSISGLVFLLTFLISPKLGFPKDIKFWLRAGFWGVIGSAIPMSCFLGALTYQSSGVTSLLLTLIPVVTMIMAHVLLGDEEITGIKLAGAIVAFIGAGLILLKGENGIAELVKPDWRGYALTGAGILAAAGSAVFARRYLKHDNAFQATGIRMITAAVVLLPYVLIKEGFHPEMVRTSGFLALLYLSIVGTFLAFLLELVIIQRFGATFAAQNNYIAPAVTTALGALLLNEQITLTIVIGMVIILIGLRMMNQSE